MTDWTIHVEADIHITEAEVWPDGDGPENPTAEDVAQAMRNHGTRRMTMRDWGLDDELVVTVENVEVW